MEDQEPLDGGGQRGAAFPVTVTVNAASRTVLLAPERMLLGMLRDELGLTGAKAGCEVGVCGACTVLVDGRPTSSCHTYVAQVDGSDVLTVEGISAVPELKRLQEAFVEQGGFQCGFCTSGQLMTAAALVLSGQLKAMTDGEIRTHMLGNLCRCGAYYGIFRAIDEVRKDGQG
jgi:xanthine dehydrogenase YagT iron-sulfur-binding subunit